MIYIYKLVERDGEITNEQMDTWDDGKFSKLSKEMSREQVINKFNRGYYFTSEIKNDAIKKSETPDEVKKRFNTSYYRTADGESKGKKTEKIEINIKEL
jgi:hypothetical protein